MLKLQNLCMKGWFIDDNTNSTASMTSLFCVEINILPLYFVFPLIFITKKCSFIVRLLHFMCIRSVLKFKYER